jgi:ribosomal protein S18 acetylase RimI-like enzyme
MSSKVLVPPSDAHVTALMQWFPDAASVAVWSPSNDFPFERERFIVQAKLRELPSFTLVDAADTALAFGQYYERLGCCHLGRLVVAPEQRGRGVGQLLIEQLIAHGTAALGIGRCSLFVLAHNTRARNLYRKLGFVETQYPEPLPLPDVLYLRREPREAGDSAARPEKNGA